jgi:translation initiation factor RLI1
MDVDAPALAPSRYGSVQGIVKNVSDEVVKNIVLKYKLNTEPLEARIDRLEPGEVKNFSTQSVMLRHVEVTFFLEEMSYE